MKPALEQFTGCILGQALGDALGFMVEGHDQSICREYVAESLDDIKSTRKGEYPFGQYSDDTQLARELMQSYVSHKQFCREDFAQRIADVFSEKRIVGRGKTTEKAANNVSQGISWKESGSPDSLSNGSAMRAAPIGLMFFDNHDQLITAACDQGRITHQHNRCLAGSVAIAAATALVLQNKRIYKRRFIKHLSAIVGKVDTSFAQHIQRLTDFVAFPSKIRFSSQRAFSIISATGAKIHWLTRDQFTGIYPLVTESVLWSLYSFLQHPNDYLEAVKVAISGGGDTDTTAAMTGAISGAYLGVDALPKNLVPLLTDKGTWNTDELTRLAGQCYEIKEKQ